MSKEASYILCLGMSKKSLETRVNKEPDAGNLIQRPPESYASLEDRIWCARYRTRSTSPAPLRLDPPNPQACARSQLPPPGRCREQVAPPPVTWAPLHRAAL